MVRLKEIREEKKLSQTELARLSGISRVTINKIENGKSNGNMKSIERLSEVLETSVESLFFSQSVKKN